MKKKGFTLIEMLVVIAIIALLAAILVPTISSAMNSAKTTKSLSNLRSIHQMLSMYTMDHKQKMMFAVHGGGQDHDWPRVLWEHAHGEFGDNPVREMGSSTYTQVMWCPVQVSKHGQTQHRWGRTSYGMNWYFRSPNVGGDVRYVDDPNQPGTREPLLVAGTPHPADASYGTYPMNYSTRFPYDTAWMNAAYDYGGKKRDAIALWLAGSARVVAQAEMIELHDLMSNEYNFQ